MLRYFDLFLLICLLITGCNKEAHLASKEYPYLITQDVIENDTTGVIFSAKLLFKGNEEIIDYGFILINNEIENEYKISILNESSIEDFQIKFSTNLEKGKNYTYRGYIQTSEHIILANKVSFTSQGSVIPTVSSFFPKEGPDRTVVTITGANFGITKDFIKVFVNNIESDIVSLKNDSIIFQTPFDTYFGNANISLKAGSKTVIIDGTFKILGPVIDSISKKEGHSGDILTIWGKYLNRNFPYVTVNFGNYSSEVLLHSENKIDFIIPIPFYTYNNLLTDQMLPIQIRNGRKTISYNNFIIRRSWEKKANPPFISFGVYEDCVSYNNKGYCLNNNLFEYNPDLNSWSNVSAFPGGDSQNYLSVVYGDKFFKIGGSNYLGKIYDFWEYDFITKNWLKRENTPFSYYQSASFIIANTLYIITDSQQVWRYNDIDKSFTRMNDFPEKIEFFFSYVIQNKAFLVNFGRTWEYDASTDHWQIKSTNPFQKGNYYKGTIGFVLNGTCYVLDSGTDLFKFDILINRWILISKYPYSGNGVYKTSFVIGDMAFIAALRSGHPDEYPLLFRYQE